MNLVNGGNFCSQLELIDREASSLQDQARKGDILTSGRLYTLTGDFTGDTCTMNEFNVVQYSSSVMNFTFMKFIMLDFC